MFLILKLADRVHNMRTISGIPEGKRRRRIAQETADVYAPLSHFMGMGRIRRELENRSLECLEPKVSAELAEILSQDPGPKSQNFMEAIQTMLQDTGIRNRVRLQAKSLPSIYRKVLRSNLSALEIHNRYFIEVVVSHRDTCYRALGVLHGNFSPVTERFKDFIALPKRNGYQALHTNVIHIGNRYEVHIQTPGMHRMGELGLATLRGNLEEKRMQWLHELAEWHDTSANSNQLMDELQRILFTREIAVFYAPGRHLRFARRCHGARFRLCRSHRPGPSLQTQSGQWPTRISFFNPLPGRYGRNRNRQSPAPQTPLAQPGKNLSGPSSHPSLLHPPRARQVFQRIDVWLNLEIRPVRKQKKPADRRAFFHASKPSGGQPVNLAPGPPLVLQIGFKLGLFFPGHGIFLVRMLLE